jgi:protein arginine kinase activator
MICQSCKKKKAVLHSYCISSNELVDVHYCEECGKKQSVEVDVCLDDSLHNLLDGLLESRKHEVVIESAKACEFCGTTLKDIRKHNNLGCPNCYELFSEDIKSLRSISEREYRKTVTFKDALPGIHMLRKELENAVRQEDFEKAAFIRDKILDCEKEGFLSDN